MCTQLLLCILQLVPVHNDNLTDSEWIELLNYFHYQNPKLSNPGKPVVTGKNLQPPLSGLVQQLIMWYAIIAELILQRLRCLDHSTQMHYKSAHCSLGDV